MTQATHSTQSGTRSRTSRDAQTTSRARPAQKPRSADGVASGQSEAKSAKTGAKAVHDKARKQRLPLYPEHPARKRHGLSATTRRAVRGGAAKSVKASKRRSQSAVAVKAKAVKNARVAKVTKGPANGANGKGALVGAQVSNGASAPRKASCTACGLCCSYVAIEVDSPATVKQATLLLWYVYHENVSLYVNADEWMVQFDTTCVHLQPDYRCGVYETRPHICREFSEQDCEVNTGDDGHTFYTAQEFMEHLKETRPRVYSFVRKHFAPPDAPARTGLAPFEKRFQAVMTRRQAAGV